MKKFYCLLGAVAMVAVATTVFAKITHEKALTQMALANIEALSADEDTEGSYVSFSFNGQNWYGVKKNSGGDWFPKLLSCGSSGQQGQEVKCWTGSGNCWNGTSCIYKN